MGALPRNTGKISYHNPVAYLLQWKQIYPDTQDYLVPWCYCALLVILSLYPVRLVLCSVNCAFYFRFKVNPSFILANIRVLQCLPEMGGSDVIKESSLCCLAVIIFTEWALLFNEQTRHEPRNDTFWILQSILCLSQLRLAVPQEEIDLLYFPISGRQVHCCPHDLHQPLPPEFWDQTRRQTE